MFRVIRAYWYSSTLFNVSEEEKDAHTHIGITLGWRICGHSFGPLARCGAGVLHPCVAAVCYSMFRMCVTQLVDPASVYMLVSKTKPCMPKYSSAGQLAGRNRRRLIKSVVV